MGFKQIVEQEEDEYCLSDPMMYALRAEMRVKLQGAYMRCKSLQCAFTDETWNDLYQRRLMRYCTWPSDWPIDVQMQGA